MEFHKLIEIKGYAAGRNGNMLIGLDDRLVQDYKYETDKKTWSIDMLICTMYVTDPEDQEYLAQFTDGSAPTDRVIIVSRKFMRLFPKTQLILIYNQNMKELMADEASCDYEAESFGHVMTYAKYGQLRPALAFKKQRKVMDKSERRAGFHYGWYLMKTGAKMQQAFTPQDLQAAAQDMAAHLTPEQQEQLLQEFIQQMQGAFGTNQPEPVVDPVV